MKCIKLANIDNGLTCADADNVGGIVSKVIFGYHEDVETWPEEPTTTTEEGIQLSTAGELSGDVTMKSGTKAYTFEFTDDTGNFSIAPQGEDGGISFLYSLALISAKIRKEVLGFMNAAKNRKMFFIVEDQNGEFYLMGDKKRGAKLVAGDGAATGTAMTDRNGTTINIQYTSPRALVYTGDTENILGTSASTSGGGGVETQG